MRFIRQISFCLFFLIITTDLFGQAIGELTMYRAEISFGETSFQGLMAYKQIGEDEYNCSMVNDIGVKAFDFKYKSGNIKFTHVISFLDKAIIRKVMKKEMSLLFEYGIPALENNGDGRVWPQKEPKPKQTTIMVKKNDAERLLLNDKKYNLHITLYDIDKNDL